MLEVSGLWINESKQGKKYMVGYMGKLKIVIFKNTYKQEGDKKPDYIMYLDQQDHNNSNNNDDSVDF